MARPPPDTPQPGTPQPGAPPLPPAALLLRGQVMHHRLPPIDHRFRYRVFSLLLDLDRLPETAARLRLLSHGRFNLLAVHDRDLGARDGTPPAAFARRLAREEGVEDVDGPVLLLSFPRVLGYVFNPLSVYWLHRRDGGLAALLYEVSNTFGERHHYLVPVAADDATSAGAGAVLEHACDKVFHVSPFIPMEARYCFRLARTPTRLGLVIRESIAGRPGLVASLSGRLEPVSDGALLRACLSSPLLTHKVTAGIHWEALSLLWKGARYHHRPPLPPRPVTGPVPSSPSARVRADVA